MPKDKQKKRKESSSESESLEDEPPPKKAPPSKKAKTSDAKSDSNEVSWDLAKNKMVKVREFRGKVYVDIREYYMNGNGDTLPSKKGISMSAEMYQKLKTLLPEIDEALKNF